MLKSQHVPSKPKMRFLAGHVAFRLMLLRIFQTSISWISLWFHSRQPAQLLVQSNSGPYKAHENNHSTGWQRCYKLIQQSWSGCDVVRYRLRFSTVLFSQISSEIRLLIVANYSLLLQLSLYFFVCSVFIRGLIHAGSPEDIVTVLVGRHLSIKVMSFASSWETAESTFVELNNSHQSSDEKARYNACFRCSLQSRIVTFRRSGLSSWHAGRTTPLWSVLMRIWIW